MKLCDFGFAKEMREISGETAVGTPLFTPPYIFKQ